MISKTKAVLRGAFLSVVMALGTHPSYSEDVSPVKELRGVWLTNVDSDVMMSREKIAEAMDFLAAHNFNIVYPVVWNKAVTLYPSDVMEKEFGVRIDPLHEGRDPLAEVITEAHRVGIEVIPWFEFGFATSYNIGGGHIIEKRPEWAALDQEGNLAKKNNFEWMNAFDPEVRQFMNDLVMEVVEKYDIDGIQGDDRLPALPSLAGYDDLTVSLYRKEFGEDPPKDYKDEQWVRWRADILTEFLAELRENAKEINPNVTISMSPSYYDWALYEYLQDSYTWVNRGLVDSIHPQAYRYDLPAYKKIVDDLVENQFTADQLSLLYPGILTKSGSYVIESDMLLECIKYNRKNGIKGEVHFFYEGLRKNDQSNAKALIEGPYAVPADIPYRDPSWRPGGYITTVGEAETSGDWDIIEIDGEEFLAEKGGDFGSAEFEIEVPVTASYHLYMRFADIPNESMSTIVSVQSPVSSDLSKEINFQNKFTNGWVKLGEIFLEEGDDNEVIVQSLNDDESKLTVIGPVMALINRKVSPDAEVTD